MTDKIDLGKGQLHFGGKLLGEVTSAFQLPAEMLEETRSSFGVQIHFVDQATAGFAKFSDQLRLYQDSAFYGVRVASLLHSRDPRQRKRGKRLRDKMFGIGRNVWTKTQAEELVAGYRKAYPKLREFWNTQHYRKD